MSKGERLAEAIQRANPHVTVRHGKSHYVVMVGPKIVGILPRKPAREGVSFNLRQQFARAGVTIP